MILFSLVVWLDSLVVYVRILGLVVGLEWLFVIVLLGFLNFLLMLC